MKAAINRGDVMWHGPDMFNYPVFLTREEAADLISTEFGRKCLSEWEPRGLFIDGVAYESTN